MRVLWFTNTSSLYNSQNNGYNGGGWISSLEKLMNQNKNIELAISFYHSDNIFKTKIGSTTYYPIEQKAKKTKLSLANTKYDTEDIPHYLKIIKDFNPDIIHIFGSEKSFGLITEYTEVPVIIHLQGILNPYLNALFAPGTSFIDYFKYLNTIQILRKIKDLSMFNHGARREELILKNCKFFMGRTSWDKEVTRLYSPNSAYFYCGEVLREVFYNAQPWTKPSSSTLQLVSTVSQTDYKGFDLILKTSKLLKRLTTLKFEWLVFGIDSYPFWEKKLTIKSSDVNVKLMGIASAENLILNLNKSDVFIHPSYIDNSPNSLAEAQLLGMPVIATYVGGIPSLIANNETGILVPANDPYSLASKIIEVCKNESLALKLAKNTRAMALQRHDPLQIVTTTIQIYNSVLNASG